MLHVARDAAGRIRAVYDHPHPEATEALPAADPEVVAFVLGHDDPDSGPVRQVLSATDLALVRVIEDLVEALVAKGLVLFTDLPKAAQDKLLHRRAARDRLHHGGSFMVGEDDIL